MADVAEGFRKSTIFLRVLTSEAPQGPTSSCTVSAAPRGRVRFFLICATARGTRAYLIHASCSISVSEQLIVHSLARVPFSIPWTPTNFRHHSFPASRLAASAKLKLPSFILISSQAAHWSGSAGRKLCQRTRGPQCLLRGWVVGRSCRLSCDKASSEASTSPKMIDLLKKILE